MSNSKQKVRVLGILFVMLAAFLGLSWRLTYLQVIRHDELTEQADATRQKMHIQPARRGDIRGRDGALLATSVPVRTVYVDAQAWAQRPPSSETIERMCRYLSLDRTGFEQQLATARRYIVLQRKVSEEVADKIRSLKIRAVGFEQDFQRRYPLGRSHCHVLGFTDFDHHGIQGVERSMELYLTGQPGWRLAPTDSRGREIVAWRQEEVLARDGYSVELTIDPVVQDIIETELEKSVKTYQPMGACAVVMQPRSGEILAMANWPTFDPNQPGAEPTENQKNIGLMNTIEPGSTFKIVTVAGAFNDQTVHPRDIFFCENGAFFYGGKTLRDSHPNGDLSVQQIITKSSNIGAAKIAIRMGPERLYHYIEAFGFGARTGIDLPGEVSGIVHPPARWSSLSITRIPMGQEIGVTALQMVRVMCALANGGELMQPFVVRRITAKDGTTIAEFSAHVVNRPISYRAAAQMNEALKTVVSPEGTAPRAAFKEWTVAGKTGTGQKYENGQPSHTKFVSSFIGYLPADDPQFCLLVLLDEPKGVYYGGQVAAPIFHDMAEKIALHLNIPAHPHQDIRSARALGLLPGQAGRQKLSPNPFARNATAIPY